jgi:hypothetical protein
MKSTTLLATFFLTVFCSQVFPQDSIKKRQEIKIPDGQYFGLKTPGLTPEVFEPDIPLFKEGRVSYAVFAPDGKTFYFQAGDSIYYMKSVHGHWNKSKIADFLGKQEKNGVLNISPDGKFLLFTNNGDIMECKKTGEGWSSPEKMPEEITSTKYECGSSMALDHSVFFGSQREGTKGQCDIFYSKYKDGRYETPMNIDKFNTPGSECGVFISPKQEFVIFTAYGRPEGYGITDMYISFPKKDGEWSSPQNMGAKINTTGPEWPLGISPDGKYFFYISNKQIYWVDIKVIDAFKNAAIIQKVPNNTEQ